MKKKEAYEILGLTESASTDEVKKAFKQKAKQLHPDVNKDPNAEQNFKKANEAYQAIENNQFEDNQFVGSPFSNGFGINFSDFGFGLEDILGFGGRKSKSRNFIIQDINLSETITFKESVLGCKKELKYKCDAMCNKCNGVGESIIDNGCKVCGGTGRTTKQQGNAFFTQTCKTCRGKIQTKDCDICKSTGKINSERTISVSIKPGITDGTILRLAGIGNFIDPNIGNSNVLLTVKVIEDKNLKLDGNDVITNINITLLEAIQGCAKEIFTIDGTKDIYIPALSKNKDEILLSALGVDRKGKERVIVNVEYPKDTTKLIETLVGEK